MRRISALGLLVVFNVLTMYAQRFDDKFSDRTLRIDYIFSGNAKGMIRGGRWEGGTGWGTNVHVWQVHVDVWQNQYHM